MMFKRCKDALLLGSIGLLLTFGGYVLNDRIAAPLLHQAKASTEWPQVDGKIETSLVHSHRDKEGKYLYRQEIEYSYTVGDKACRSHVVWFGDDYSSSFESSHRAVVDRYPIGKLVPVFYNPSQPEIAVLEPGAKFSSYVLYVVGWFGMGIGGLLLFSALRTLVSPW